jgi:hypothetical protein
VNGDTVITDSVVFRALVVRAGNDTLKDNTSDGTLWMSGSSGAVIEMKDDSVGAFRASGEDTVFVEFTDLDLPGEPFELPIEVTTYNTTIDVTTLVPGSDHLATGDTVITDSVRVTSTVTRASDGAARVSSIAYLESTDSTVVGPRDSTVVKDEALFADTGTATITAHLAQPQLPRTTLQSSIPLKISTYLVTAESATPATPVMGDTVQYDATVIDTRDGSEIGSPGLDFASSNSTAVRILSATTGRALARDLGSAEVNVTLTDPDLPRGTVADTFAVTDITEERFYGTIDVTSGDFGDLVVIAASEVHTFTDTTKVFFPNGTVLFVDMINATLDTMWTVVGAGTNTGQLTMRGLKANGTSDRDSVTTVFTFAGGGDVNDEFEPNDEFPLDPLIHRIDVLPFDAILAIDPTKMAPPDSNFFYIRVTAAGGITINIKSETQQDSNIDFFICNALGGGIDDPPTGYDSPPGCARERSLNDGGADIRVEEENGVTLGLGRHVIGFYCSEAGPCPTEATTYEITIEQQ